MAQDIEDYDLFMDLFNVTKSKRNLVDFSTAAFSQAAAILHAEDRDNGNLSIAVDCHSESVCSQSTISDENSKLKKPQPQINNNNSNNNHQRKHQKITKNYVPPLPSLKSKVLNAEMININIPKPDVKIPSANNTLLQQFYQRNRTTINNNSEYFGGVMSTSKKKPTKFSTYFKAASQILPSLTVNDTTNSFGWKNGGRQSTYTINVSVGQSGTLQSK